MSGFNMSSAEKVSTRIQRMKRGVPFAISNFYPLGSRASVEKAMSRLAKEGVISRVSRGFYVRPKPLKSIPSINVTTSAKQVARAWAKENEYKLVSQGEESAYRLGFQTQAPVKEIFWSNGPSRRFEIGKEVVEVRHISKKKLRWAKLPVGELYRSFFSVSPESIGIPQMREALKRLSISEKESKSVLHKLSSAPLPSGWQQKLESLEKVV
jgi:hypothetical protein